MIYGSSANVSRRAKRLIWAPRPAQPIDNPVRRYLKARRLHDRSGYSGSRGSLGRGLRPAL